MRIGIDGRSLTGPSRGVAVYLRQLLDAMAETHPGDERVLLGARARAAHAAAGLHGP